MNTRRISGEVVAVWLVTLVIVGILLGLLLGFQHNISKFSVAVNAGLVECRTEGADTSYSFTRWLTPDLCEVLALASMEHD